MLYKNDVEFKLTKEQKKEYAVAMKFTLPPSLKKWNPTNKRWDIPKSTNMDPFYNYFDQEERETVMLRYVTLIQKRKDNEIEYSPDLITITHSGELITNKEQADLNYFLCNHPQNGSNPNRDDKKTVKFLRENKAEIAKEKAEKSKALAAANSFIWTTGKIEKLRTIAKSLEVAMVDDMSDEEVQVELETIAKANPVLFIQKTEGANIAYRAKSQEAIDLSVIYYNEDEKEWRYTGPDKEKEDKIVGVQAGQDKTEVLIAFLAKVDKKGHFKNIEDKVAQALGKRETMSL